MNREETREAIKVMQHYVDGGNIEGKFRSNSDWQCADDGPVWNWWEHEYRIRSDEPDESDIGKMVEVTDHRNGSCWMRRKLVALIDHKWKYICEDQLGAGVCCWLNARRIKETP